MSLCSHLYPTPSIPLCAASFAVAVVSVALVPLVAVALPSAHSPLNSSANDQASYFTLLLKSLLVKRASYYPQLDLGKMLQAKKGKTNTSEVNKSKEKALTLSNSLSGWWTLWDGNCSCRCFSIPDAVIDLKLLWNASKWKSGCILLLCNVQTCHVTS